MEPRCSVVAVHGISGESGKTQAGFSDELAALVMDDPSWRKKFWREAVWEGECDEFDEEVGKVVSELVNSCSFGSFMQFFRERSATRKGFSDLFADFGQCVSWFANRGMSDFVSWVLDHVLDLPLYLGISYGERMRAVVRKRIRLAARQTGGVVVVGHSLGSVIAYDVVAKLLRKPNPPDIKALVTMGSPLEWVSALRKKQKGIIPVPESLKWVNFYNKVDPVPLKRALPQTMFHGIENVEITVRTSNPLKAHSAYWTNGTVAGRIRQLVGIPEGGVTRGGPAAAVKSDT